jgi:hypothetical protein
MYMTDNNIFLQAPKNVSEPLSRDQFLNLIAAGDGNSAAKALGTRTDSIVNAIVWRLSKWKFFKAGNLKSMNSRDYITESESPFKAKDAIYNGIIAKLEENKELFESYGKSESKAKSNAKKLTNITTNGGPIKARAILENLENTRMQGVYHLIASAEHEKAVANQLKTLNGGRRGRSSRKLNLFKDKKTSRYYSRRA